MEVPGELVASGRAADVFDMGPGLVLRRYRTERDCEPEGRLMNWLHARGLPVPQVHRSKGRDVVMERIDGPTMMQDLEKRPWMVVTHLRTLATLQKQVNAIAAPSWLATDERIPAGDALLHLDLHPMNVILGPSGPVIIDWTNAARGDADFDAALTYVLMATFEADDATERTAQFLVTRLFRLFRGRRAIRGRLPAAARFRLQDPNVTAAERTALNALLAP